MAMSKAVQVSGDQSINGDAGMAYMILLVVRAMPCIHHPGSLADGNELEDYWDYRDDLDGQVVGP